MDYDETNEAEMLDEENEAVWVQVCAVLFRIFQQLTVFCSLGCTSQPQVTRPELSSHSTKHSS